MVDAESSRITISISDGEETYMWTYPPEQQDAMRDVIVEQVEEGRLHPYLGVMVLHAMGKDDEF